jgi:MarR family transcriptional repressor of emrRAB
MKGIERLVSVDSSTPRMERALPDLAMPSTVMVRLLRISVFGMSAFFEPLFRSLDLSESEFHVMCLLVASGNGTASPSELTELVGTTRANMTRILDELVAAGYITRSTSTRDGRRQVVAINATGRRKVRETVPKIAGPLKAGFSGLSDDEMKMLDGLLRKLIVSFDKGAVSIRAAA